MRNAASARSRLLVGRSAATRSPGPRRARQPRAVAAPGDGAAPEPAASGVDGVGCRAGVRVDGRRRAGATGARRDCPPRRHDAARRKRASISRQRDHPPQYPAPSRFVGVGELPVRIARCAASARRSRRRASRPRRSSSRRSTLPSASRVTAAMSASKRTVIRASLPVEPAHRRSPRARSRPAGCRAPRPPPRARRDRVDEARRAHRPRPASQRLLVALPERLEDHPIRRLARLRRTAPTSNPGSAATIARSPASAPGSIVAVGDLARFRRRRRSVRGGDRRRRDRSSAGLGSGCSCPVRLPSTRIEPQRQEAGDHRETE